MFDFALPSLGSDMEEGTLTEWLVKPGDEVKRGQAVATVDTAKAAVDVEIWRDGTVHRLLVEPGTTVSVGAAMASLLEPGEAEPAEEPVREAALVREAAPPREVTPVRRAAPVGAEARRPRVSPAARREAERLGLDLASITGTGPMSSITLADIDRAAAEAAAAAPTVTKDKTREMRRAIAASMSRSKREIPHYYLTEQIPLQAAGTWLERENAGRSITERVLMAAVQLKAVAVAATRFPDLNGFWQDGEFRPQSSVHIGVAISLRQGGLVAPAIHDTAEKPLVQLMKELTDLVARVRAGSMRSSEMSDPTLTVTNLGDRSVDAVYGVIYPPQVALVGFGKPAERPWVVDGEVRALPVVTGTLAADHRASDGHRGALFLAAINNIMQHPEEL